MCKHVLLSYSSDPGIWGFIRPEIVAARCTKQSKVSTIVISCNAALFQSWNKSNTILWFFTRFICQHLNKQKQIFKVCICVSQRARPKSDQEENELVMASLRNMYEERQKNHQHTLTADGKQVTCTYIIRSNLLLPASASPFLPICL